jgi:S1-C subfamily serine protease
VEVAEVVPDSPADDAGIRAEDLLLEVNGTAIERVEDLQRLMTAELVGTRVRMRILRGGSEREIRVVPAELDTALRARR